MITEKDGIKNMTGKMFRLVHNGEKILALIEGTDITVTSTSHSVEEHVTKQGAFNRINDLDLEYVQSDGIETI